MHCYFLYTIKLIDLIALRTADFLPRNFLLRLRLLRVFHVFGDIAVIIIIAFRNGWVVSMFPLCNQLLNAFWHHHFCSIIVGGRCVRYTHTCIYDAMPFNNLQSSIQTAFFLLSSLLFTTMFSNNWIPLTSSSPSKHEWLMNFGEILFWWPWFEIVNFEIEEVHYYHVISNLCNKLCNQSTEWNTLTRKREED